MNSYSAPLTHPLYPEDYLSILLQGKNKEAFLFFKN